MYITAAWPCLALSASELQRYRTFLNSSVLCEYLQELSSPHRTMIEVLVQSLIDSSSLSGQNPPIAMGSSHAAGRRKFSEPGVYYATSRAHSDALELQGGGAGGGVTSSSHGVTKTTPRKSLRQQRSVSTGVLDNSTPTTTEPFSESGSHHDHKTSTAVGSVSAFGNPLTRYLDSTAGIGEDRGSTAPSSLVPSRLSTAANDSITSEDARPRVHASRRSSHPTRKEVSAFSRDFAPRATGVQTGGGEGRGGGGGVEVRVTSTAVKHQKFKPRSFAELEAQLEMDEAESSVVPSSGRTHTKEQVSAHSAKKKFSLDERTLSVRTPESSFGSSTISSSGDGGDMDLGMVVRKKTKAKGMTSFYSTGSLGKQQPLEKSPTRRSGIVEVFIQDAFVTLYRWPIITFQVPGDVMCEDLEDLDMSLGVSSSGLTGIIQLTLLNIMGSYNSTNTVSFLLLHTVSILLKMGRYYNTTMCHYWDMLVN